MGLFSDRSTGIRAPQCLMASLVSLITLSSVNVAHGQVHPRDRLSTHSHSANPDASSPQIAQARRAIPVVFKPRKDAPRPRITAGGASRRNCLTHANPSLQAIVPKQRREMTLTTVAYPTLLVYVPATSAPQAEFGLRDEEDNILLTISLDLPKEVQTKPMVLRLTVPNTALQATTGLQENKPYYWYFAVVCEPKNRFADAFVSQQIIRIPPDATLQQQLTTAKELDKVRLYAEAGIWYDAIAELAKLRLAKPTDPDLIDAWQSLLQSSGWQDTFKFTLPPAATLR